MPSRSCAAIRFDIGQTSIDDDRASSLALTSFRATPWIEFDISFEDLIARWQELLRDL
jgi:hypothetical protein